MRAQPAVPPPGKRPPAPGPEGTAGPRPGESLLRDEVGRGVAYALAANLLFSIAGVVVKWYSTTYSLVEIVFFRSCFALVPALVLLWRSGGLVMLRTERPVGHAVRALIWTSSVFFGFLALRYLPLADATAYSFAAPLFVTALSMPLLGEKVGVHRWTAVVVGFSGVLLIAQPHGDALQLGAFFGVLNSLSFALGSLSVRQLSRTEPSVTIVFYTMLSGALFASILLPFFWTTPSLVDALILAATGISGGIAQFWITQAYHNAPASVVAPFAYSSIVWAVLFGWLIWGDLPDIAVIAGSAVVIGSGLYILHRETLRARLARAASGAAG